jgi:hypothetical protein
MIGFQAKRDESRRQLRECKRDSGLVVRYGAIAFLEGTDFSGSSLAVSIMPSTNPAAARRRIGPESPATSLAFTVGFRIAHGPNQAPEPTPTSGTVAAEPLGVPAAVVAHL